MKIQLLVLGITLALVSSLAAQEGFFEIGDPNGTSTTSGALGPTHPPGWVQAGPMTPGPRPPQANDHVFVGWEPNPANDNFCLFRSAGPLTVPIPVTRYLGETDAEGYLLHADSLIANGFLKPFALIELPVWDVDQEAATPPLAPERDEVYWNGRSLTEIWAQYGLSGQSPYLTGANNRWKINKFRIPIQAVRFPVSEGTLNPNSGAVTPPTPMENELKIEIDVGNIPFNEELWCTNVNWAALRIQCFSPIFLIHGSSQSGPWWDRRGFTQTLQGYHLPYYSGLSMQNATVAQNAVKIDRVLKEGSKKFGADTFHVVTHSKGGLDTRGWLHNHYLPRLLAGDLRNRAISLTTLSGPHHGSVLADLLVYSKDYEISWIHQLLLSGGPDLLQGISEFRAFNPSHPNLTTGFASAFNNLVNPGHNFLKDRFMYFYAVGADMDNNQDGDVYAFGGLAFDGEEGDGLKEDAPGDPADYPLLIDYVYQVLKQYKKVSFVAGNPPKMYVEPGFSIGNDVLVTIESAMGFGAVPDHWGHGLVDYSVMLKDLDIFEGARGRNHATVGDDQSAEKSLIWQLEAEMKFGDLHPF